VAGVDDRPVPNELGRRRLQLVSGTGGPTRSSTGLRTAGRPAPSNPAVRIAAARSGDVAAAQRREPRPEPPRAPRVVEEIVAPEPGLDVSDSDAAAEARRAERRRARAARSASSGRAEGGAADAGGDGGVVTIRATRARPPVGEAELVLPADRPSLRPAQPAAQPRKRLFNRNGR
jgi:hypothetical protein